MKGQVPMQLKMGNQYGQQQNIAGIEARGEKLVNSCGNINLPSESLIPISHSVAGLTKSVFLES